MTGERPDDAREPEETSRPADGGDGLEARRASASDAPFPGLRSAADIFGAPRSEDEWPSRRERREAERAAAEAGEPAPEPFQPTTEAPTVDPDADDTVVAPAPGQPGAPVPPPPPPAVDDGATQAISMADELAAPTPVPTTPAPATASHPLSIQLPTARSHRDEREAEARVIDDERRRVDPDGTGRDDVDWLGRATGTQPPAGPRDAHDGPAGLVGPPIGVADVLPSADEPPSFTDLLRLGGDDDRAVPAADRPFDWSVHDDETGEVAQTLTTGPFDTTSLAPGSWSATPAEDDPAASTPEVTDAPDGGPGLPSDAPTTALPVVTDDVAPHDIAPDEPATTTPSGSWSLGEAAEDTPTAAFEPPRSEDGAVPWWAEPEATVPPTAAPPLVEPVGEQEHTYPAHLPPAVGQDLDAVLGLRDDEPVEPAVETPRGPAPEDLDQSEWQGRETSDTSAIKDLFGTEAVDQLHTAGYDPHETGTRMMPAVAQPAHAPAPGRVPVAAAPSADGGRDNFINEGFARLQGEGKRGKQLLIWGSVALIVVMLVAVFALTRWILGNTIEDHTTPTKSPAAASAQATRSTTRSATPAAPASTAPVVTTPAGPGAHTWNELAGGECLSPYTNGWADTFTVVDCTAAHQGQLTARGTIDSATWPGADALKALVAERCQSAEALDLSAATAVGDVQVQGTYPPDQASWDAGDRFWSCFVSRSGGGELTRSLAPTA